MTHRSWITNGCRFLAFWFVGVFALLTLVSCGGGGGGGGGTAPATPTGPPAPTAPSAPSVSLGFSVKQLQFSWTAASGATSYRLLQDSDGASGFSQVGSDLAASATSTNLDIAVHRHNWAAARYALDACNSVGCTRSNVVTTTAGMLAAIGYFKASNTGSGDGFGSSVALSGDGNTLAVGAAAEDSNATGINGAGQADNSFPFAGAVYVFTRSGGAWSQQAYVKASNTGGGDPMGDPIGDTFGQSVALSGDGNTLAVGAGGEDSNATGINGVQNDNSAPRAGAVYVYTRSAGAWSQQAYVKASNTGAQDAFGFSVALSGDGNTLAVGANFEASAATGINDIAIGQGDNTAPNAGAVYVFTRTGATWLQQAYVKASNTGAQDQFGFSVALSGDGNTLAVGALFEASSTREINSMPDKLAADAGAVYVFTRSGSLWTQQAYVKPPNTDAGDNFGNSVALSGDGNTLAVGARFEDSQFMGVVNSDVISPENNLFPNSGAAYVFTRSGIVWSQQAYVKPSNTSGDDRFGVSVALSGDGNTLAVGANFEDSDATGIGGEQFNFSTQFAGAAYVYTRSGGVWSQRAYVKASNTGASDGFGSSVALSGDGNTLAVGAGGEASNATGINGNQADNSLVSAGAVYLY